MNADPHPLERRLDPAGGSDDTLFLRLTLGSVVWLAGAMLFSVTSVHWAGGPAGVAIGSLLVFAGFIWLYLMYGWCEATAATEIALAVGFVLARFGLLAAGLDGVFGGAFASLSWAIAAYFGGRLLARLVDRPGYLLPVAVIASLTDIWSVVAGPTHALIENGQAALLVAGAPQDLAVSASAVGFQQIGVADLVFVSFFLAVGRRFDLPMGWTVRALVAALAVCSLSVSIFGVALPALPFLCGAFICAHWSKACPGGRELKLTATFAGAMIALMLSLSLLGGSG